jgi:phosphoribosylformylglycinamidine cyclo-ligase
VRAALTGCGARTSFGAVTGLTYRDAGVDIDAGDALVERIKPMARATHTRDVLGAIGGFAGAHLIPSGMREPVLISGTDGVGTKLKVAFAADRHDTVGIDLVAMSVNDVLTTGARPLFFLDYFATGALDVPRAAKVIEGIAEGCRQAGCALLGGETAELPGMYHAGEYDLAGFAVGIVERSRMLPRADVAPGDVVLGVASSGLHSNGYSLARKVLLERAGLDLHARPDGLGEPLVDALLRPTRIYCRSTLAALDGGGIKALCHVTGGGLVGNVPRVLPAGCGVELTGDAWPRPAIFDLIARLGGVDEDEMRRAFNLGIGLVVVVEAGHADAVLETLRRHDEHAWRIGSVIAETGDAPRVRFA